jgi:type 1 glutamine amidotransferase
MTPSLDSSLELNSVFSFRSIVALIVAASPTLVWAADPWVVYEGTEGIGKGKHIVFVSGDEEYRSEEALPQLGKILAKHHGFKCSVLFAIDPKTGLINPNVNDNIPGLEALKSADLMVIATRFRNLPDDQMKHIADYVDAGKPIVGLRTATHAFNMKGKTFAKFSWDNKVTWDGGFGRQVLGETWVNHHGAHGSQATRGVIAPGAKEHPILRGFTHGGVFGLSDVYTVRLPLSGDSESIILGEVVNGMKQDDPALKGAKNDPMMPVAWTKTYKGVDGKSGRVFTTTMGASQDLTWEGTRRLIVNACIWAMGMEKQIPEFTNVGLVGEFKPTQFRFVKDWKGTTKPADLKGF